MDQATYEKEIAPLLYTLLEKALAHKLPCLFAIQVDEGLRISRNLVDASPKLHEAFAILFEEDEPTDTGPTTHGSDQDRVDEQRGADLHYDLILTFEEAVFGCQKEMVIERWETCPACYGDSLQTGNGATPCQECHGQGQVYRKRSIVVNIPAGVDDGINIRVTGEGEVSARGGTPGDLYVILTVKPHLFFERQGNDLIYELSISVNQALSGAEVKVPTVDNKSVPLKIPPGTQDGHSFRLKGMGVPVVYSSAHGDLIVIVKAVSGL